MRFLTEYPGKLSPNLVFRAEPSRALHITMVKRCTRKLAKLSSTYDLDIAARQATKTLTYTVTPRGVNSSAVSVLSSRVPGRSCHAKASQTPVVVHKRSCSTRSLVFPSVSPNYDDHPQRLRYMCPILLFIDSRRSERSFDDTTQSAHVATCGESSSNFRK